MAKSEKIKAMCLCGKPLKDEKEVKEFEFILESNYIEDERSVEALEDAMKAWDYAKTIDNLELSDILEIHRILMKRLNPRIAGRLRKVGVHVGNRICPNPGSVRRLLYQWMPSLDMELKAITDVDKDLKAELCKEVHVRFEKIHPFEDGNGRVGRILLNWHRLKVRLPVLVIKELEKQKYYEWFKD